MFERTIPVKAPVMRARAELYLKVKRADGSEEDLGLVSTRVVTNAFVEKLVDAMQGAASIADFKYHQSGTGSTAESASDAGLESPVGSRVAGSQGEYAANVYETVATINYDADYTITEHGVFDATTGGTLLDRSVFGGISVSNGDSITFTYRITFNAGG